MFDKLIDILLEWYLNAHMYEQIKGEVVLVIIEVNLKRAHSQSVSDTPKRQQT